MQKRVFKTVKTLSGAGRKYRKWAEWETGDIVIGKYDSVSIDNYKKNSYAIQVIEAMFKDGTGKNYDGSILALNSNGMVDKAMANLLPGALVQLEYEGKSLIEKGPYSGKEAHIVKVLEVTEDDGGSAEDDL